MFDFDTALTVISVTFAGIQLYRTRKTQEKKLSREKQKDTLEAFNKLQSQVFDELNKYTKTDFAEIAKTPREKDYKEKTVLIARCEHFAVGIKREIYDFETFRELGGKHFYYLFEKVLPIIEKARKISNDENLYSAFEELYIKLKPYYER